VVQCLHRLDLARHACWLGPDHHLQDLVSSAIAAQTPRIALASAIDELKLIDLTDRRSDGRLRDAWVCHQPARPGRW
jgi:hypothetical protein